MARNNFVASTQATAALTANTTQTILLVIAAANTKVAIKSATITFDSANAAQQGITAELVRFTMAGAGTGATTQTPAKKLSLDPTLSSVVKKTYATEPTVATVIGGFTLNASGGLQYPFAINEEVIAQNGEGVGIRITTPTGVTGVNAYANMECEE
jgi:hypothetical protein